MKMESEKSPVVILFIAQSPANDHKKQKWLKLIPKSKSTGGAKINIA